MLHMSEHCAETCISSNFGHQVALLALVVNLAWGILVAMVELEEVEEEEERPRSRALIHQIIFAFLFAFAHL